MTDYISQIKRLKKERGAVILAHYYQTLDLQLAADHVGDSYALSKIAKTAPESTIVFCGVRFMAESAKILSPDKTVLLPNENAGCPMADMVTPEIVRELRAAHPDAAVVCYVNSSAETKAECDICCTSSNALRVVRSLPNRKIIFVPDKNLGAYVAAQCPEKEFVFMRGWCPIHKNITREEVLKAKAAHPNALFTVHPECEPDVVELADFAGSTAEILDYCTKSGAEEFIIGTEVGVVERLTHFCPDKKLYLLSSGLVCPNMKKTTMEDLYNSLANGTHEIELSDELIAAANAPLEKMIMV